MRHGAPVKRFGEAKSARPSVSGEWQDDYEGAGVLIGAAPVQKSDRKRLSSTSEAWL